MAFSCAKNYALVVQAGVLTLAASVNPGCRLDNVSLTATVTGLGAGPTGNVDFKEGLIVLATQPVVGGVATWNTSSLTVGLHNLTATFVGTGSFSGVTLVSNGLAEQINCCYTDFSQIPTSFVTLDAQPVIDWWTAWLGFDPFASHGPGFHNMSIIYQAADAVVWETPPPLSAWIDLYLYSDGNAFIDSYCGCYAQFVPSVGVSCVWDGVHRNFTAYAGSGYCNGHPFPGGGFDF